MRPFHSYQGCPHCALRCCLTPVSMPGHWGSTPCCCQSWTDGRYPDLAIAVTPIYQTQDPRQYEARARVSVFEGWSLHVIRPLANLGPLRQGQARRGWFSLFDSLVRPTLMHTKNLYENGPNPFFFRDQKHERRPSYAYGFGLLCFRQTRTGLPMRVRYSNEIAEWKWPPIFQNKRVRYARKSRRAGPLQ